LPWGDVTAKGNKLFVSVFEWPASGNLYIPGLKTGINSAHLLNGQRSETIEHSKSHGWTILRLPPRAPEKLVSVIELELEGQPAADPMWGIDPNVGTEIVAEFASVQGAEKSQKRWMEKFGEWKSTVHVHGWTPGGKAVWQVDVLQPGDYLVELSYAGDGRLVWGVDVEGGEHIQNQQNSSHNYQQFPMGWIHFAAPGRYKVGVSCLEGNAETASLASIRFFRVRQDKLSFNDLRVATPK
jgi:alpha-L-fucosidase